jgi:ubiquinone/menaquinone biosynthesis C-methylase UbiE
VEYHPGWLYDKMYSSKDYASETGYLHRLIQKLHPRAQTLLDLACGTGQHLFHLKRHYRAEGLDLSEKLLEAARARNPGLVFHQGDMRHFSLDKRFDVITCLFSAIGYAGSVDGLESSIDRMARHLNLGGVLLVEPWFSPDQWNHGQCHITVIDEPEVKIARLNTSRQEGRLSILDFHYLVATP